MKKFLKKALALILALVMCVGMMATTAFAAECDHDWVYLRCGITEGIKVAHCRNAAHTDIYQCTKCGETMQKVAQTHDSHKSPYYEIKEETHIAKCHACQRSTERNHKYTRVAATCSVPAICECGKLDPSGTLNAANHPAESLTQKVCEDNPTMHAPYCTACDSFVEGGTPEAHTPGTWTPDASTACSGTVDQTTNCTQCNAEMTQSVTGTGSHSLTKTEAKAAACTEPGNKEYWTCSVCGKLFSDAGGKTETTEDAVVIPANDHKAAEGWVNTDPDNHWHACANCDATDDTAKFGTAPHAYNWTSDGKGGYDGKCECGKTAHSDGAPAHTCVFDGTWLSADGKHFHECTKYPECHEKKDEGDHDSAKTTKAAVAATCRKTGLTEELSCSVCEAVTQTQAETGRDPANHDETCATHWENRGNATGHIQVRTCGAAVGSVAAHSWGRWATVSPGREERECTVCHAVASRPTWWGPRPTQTPHPAPAPMIPKPA